MLLTYTQIYGPQIDISQVVCVLHLLYDPLMEVNSVLS